uniref:Glycosyltransferase n=1 Tax=viral metagenome TaxID=1070528 RepID=A0A6C0CSK9_9ZZZZ
MQSLNLFLIHSSSLTLREQRMHLTVKQLEQISQKYGYHMRTFKINTFEPNDLQPKLEEISKQIRYDKTGDEDFDRGLQPLSVQQLSNFYKQKEALKQIVQIGKLPMVSPKDLYLILEDDALILPEFQRHLEYFFENPASSTWDVLTFSMSKPFSNPADLYEYIDARGFGKVLPGKESYMIQPKIAEMLLKELETIQFSYRLQLSYWLYTHPEVQFKCPSHRIFIEGSKIGFLPSSTTENNVLVYNQEFMEMFKMMVGQIDYDFQKGRQCYRVIEHLKSPEAMHLYAVMLHRENKLEQSKDMFINALNEMVAKQGLITPRSELLNNAINIHGIVQEDFDKITLQPSKYKEILV